MVPQNGPQQLRSNQPSNLSAFVPANPTLDPSSFTLDSPEVAKQMAALTAANQARIAQNSRIMPSTIPTSGGTSSASYLGGINSHTNFPIANHDLLTSSGNGHTNFSMPNNYTPPQPSNSISNNSFLDPAMSQPNPRTQTSTPSSLKARQQGFLQSLGNFMAKRGSPLPPALTGKSVPNYDPTHSPWSIIEPASEVGAFRLAGKDVDLFKLWGLVFQHGGGHAISNWNAILPHFDLPDEFPEVQHNGSTSVAVMLSHYYKAILLPFEEMYKKNIQEQQKKAHMLPRQNSMPGQSFPNSSPGMPRPPVNNQQSSMRPSNSAMNQVAGPSSSLSSFPPQHVTNRSNPAQGAHPLSSESRNIILSSELDSLTADGGLSEQDMQGMKRKHDQDDKDVKRARQKTDPPEGSVLPGTAADTVVPQLRSTPTTSLLPIARSLQQQPSRRKIEYIPLAREVDTYGGRDLKAIENEWTGLTQRRPLRDLPEWGTIDIDALTMSIRSRLSIELSYALTTFTILSTMRGQAPGSGFPISQCGDLLDEILDLVDDLAFQKPNIVSSVGGLDAGLKIFTNRELVTLVYDVQGLPFAPMKHQQGSKDPASGPLQRPGDIILTVTNIIRNLSIIQDNLEFMASHARLISILLRLCDVHLIDGIPTPVSTALSMADSLQVRKDTLYTLSNIANLINLSVDQPPKALHTAERIFNLIASYLVNQEESVSPLASIQIAGAPPNPGVRPPPLADVALEVLTRFSQSDVNRQALTKEIPQSTLWLLLTNLVHRLPIIDADFVLVQREYWLSYVEKIVLAIYSIVFLAPVELKQRIKTDRGLSFRSVVLRMVHKALMSTSQDTRPVLIFTRRAVEAMKVLDKTEDSLDTSEITTPTLSFGMGFSEMGDATSERGTGILGGQQDVAWDIFSLPDVMLDGVLFNELDSLVRVECQ